MLSEYTGLVKITYFSCSWKFGNPGVLGEVHKVEDCIIIEQKGTLLILEAFCCCYCLLVKWNYKPQSARWPTEVQQAMFQSLPSISNLLIENVPFVCHPGPGNPSVWFDWHTELFLIFIFIVIIPIFTQTRPQSHREFILSPQRGTLNSARKGKLYGRFCKKKIWPVRMAYEIFFNLTWFNVKPARVQTKSTKSYPNSTIQPQSLYRGYMSFSPMTVDTLHF